MKKHAREDCSDTGDTPGSISTELPSDKECEKIVAIGPTMVSGMCRTSHEGKYERRTSKYEWEFHRE